MKHFALDKNRKNKALMIEAVLKDYLKKEIKNLKILDIGCGNGEIADFFAKNNIVYTCDIEDQRKNKSLTKFKKINENYLPYKNNFFDIVISNHVIEHINKNEQKKHLQEIMKILKKGGILYFVTENWFFPIEPHYKIPLIHYFPNKVFFRILKLLSRFEEEINLINYFQIRKMIKIFKKNTEYTNLIIKNTKKFNADFKQLSFYNKNLNFLSPTNVFVLEK